MAINSNNNNNRTPADKDNRATLWIILAIVAVAILAYLSFAPKHADDTSMQPANYGTTNTPPVNNAPPTAFAPTTPSTPTAPTGSNTAPASDTNSAPTTMTPSAPADSNPAGAPGAASDTTGTSDTNTAQ